MSIPIVSMDEAGQTGQNLLDLHQPVFTLASVDLDENEAIELIGRSKEELHFVKARKNQAGRTRIVELLNALPVHRVKAVTINKPFMTTCKIVDQLVEPQMTAEGIDGYADGSLLALANVWHFCCDAAVGPTFLPDLHRLFVAAVGKGDESAVDRFYDLLGKAVKSTKLELPAMEEMWLYSREHFLDSMDDQALPVLEPGVPAAQALVYEWAKVHPTGFEVRHDHRNEIADWIECLGVYYGTDQAPTEFTFRDGLTINLPVPVTTFGTADSDEHPSIQIADVVASATTYLLRDRISGESSDRFAADLAATPVLDFVLTDSSVWPNPDFLDAPPAPGPAGEFDRVIDWLRTAEGD